MFFRLVVEIVAEVKHFATGIIGFRVWTLQAFDANAELIAECSKDYGMLGNEAKLGDFLSMLHEKNYKLSEDQINEISEALSLNFAGVFNRVKELAPAAARLYAGDITAVAALYDGDATE